MKKIWTTFSTTLIVLTTLFSVVWGGFLGGGAPDEQDLSLSERAPFLLDVFISVASLLAVVARMSFLKRKIPQRVIHFADWVVIAYPFIFALTLVWAVFNLPVTERPWTGLAALFLFTLALFAVCAVLICLSQLLKELKTQPPQSFMGWCHRLSGWALLAVVGVGGSLSGMAWGEHNRIGKTPYLCFRDFVTKGVMGTQGPGLDAYLDGLTNGTSIDTEWGWTASEARWLFLYAHTTNPYGKCAPLDEAKYEHWLHRTSVEYDWPEAHYLLAIRYGYGDSVDGEPGKVGIYSPPDSSESKHIPYWAREGFWVRAVSDKEFNGEGLDLEKSFAMLRKAADGGDYFAQWYLSNAYAQGVWGRDGGYVLDVDYDKSTYWLEKFVEQHGSRFGFDSVFVFHIFHMLGHRYLFAERYGMRRDDGKAYEYMAKSAGSEERHARTLEAMLGLAFMYREGLGVAPSAERARFWQEKAAAEFAEVSEEGREALELLREEENIALVQVALEEKRQEFEREMM